MPETAAFTVTADRCPRLLYASSASDTITVTLVDQTVVTDPRERAICRALLIHALALIDAEDADRPTGGA